jgi:S1-C subfamily serine protease
MKLKKFLRFLGITIFIFLVGGFGAVFLDFYAIPRLSTKAPFSKYEFFKKATENVTIINKTEQVTVKEEDSVNKVASQAAASVVNIISITADKSISQNKQGTGVIITSDGLVATYRDAIIEKDSSYRVLTSNGSSYEARLAGVDEFTNLTYLKLDASNLPAIPIANSNDSYPGKKLIAIGNSTGEYQNRFSAGLLSNTNKNFNLAGKTLSSSEKLEGVFETDFSGQGEYLGGPVVNYNSELVGINGSITIDNQKKYFQISSNNLRRSMELAIKNELGNRPALGIYYVPITKAHYFANNLSQDRGALIYSVSGKQGLAIISGSAAEKAGLEINDIIIAINGQEVNLDNPLSNMLSNYKKGDEVELLIVRNGQEMKVKVKLM